MHEAETGLPVECERILPAADLGAVLGLPLDSVVSRTTVGVPEPSVGRTERVACGYAAAPAAASRDIPRGEALLDVNAAHYVDAAAATAQWQLNVDVEDGPKRELAIGAARAVLIERPGASVLTVVHESATVALVLPEVVRVGDHSVEDTLVDLALRVLPQVSGPDAPATGDVLATEAGL